MDAQTRSTVHWSLHPANILNAILDIRPRAKFLTAVCESLTISEVEVDTMAIAIAASSAFSAKLVLTEPLTL